MKKMKTGGMNNPNKAAKAAPTSGSKAVPYKKGGASAAMMKKGGSTKKK